MSLLSDLLGRKDRPKPKADFSNTRSGGSTQPAPATPPLRPAPSAAPRPDFSNVSSGSSHRPETHLPTPAAPLPASPVERTVTVAAGDSLSKIARREYGDANQWRRIFEANREQISDPDMIHPGQQLRIPQGDAQ